MISGLRRLAGIFAFNSILMQASDDVFYDNLDMMVNALRGNVPAVNHYLTGLEGAGHKTAQKIADKFSVTIQIITNRLKMEKNQERLVQLLNALLWNYDARDLQTLAEARTIEVLSGNVEELHNTVR